MAMGEILQIFLKICRLQLKNRSLHNAKFVLLKKGKVFDDSNFKMLFYQKIITLYNLNS